MSLVMNFVHIAATFVRLLKCYSFWGLGQVSHGGHKFWAKLIIQISEGGTNSCRMHYLANSQSYWGLNFLLRDTKFMNTWSFTIDFKKISRACD